MTIGKNAAEERLRVRSQKAWDIAHRLAGERNRSIKDVVEDALEFYARQGGHLDILAEVDRRWPKKATQ